MSSVGPLYALNAPTSFEHEFQVTPEGVTGLQFGPGLDAPMGGIEGGPQFNGHYVRGKTNYYDGNTAAANTTDTRHYAQNVRHWQKGDTVPGVPCFALLHDLNPLTHHDRHSYEMFGAPQLNRRLKYDPAWRKQFGSHPNASVLRRAFTMLGIQQSKQPLLNSGLVYNEENNVVTRGRVRIPNLALASAGGPPVAEGSVIWMLWRRYRYTCDDLANEMAWEPRQDAQELVPTRKRTATVMEAPSGGPLPDIDADWELELTDDPPAAPIGAAAAAEEFYWAVDFWATTTHAPPHPMLYTGEFGSGNEYVGDYERIGLVTHVAKGHNSRTAEQVTLARRALHPVTRGEDFIEPLRTLHEVEIMFREG